MRRSPHPLLVAVGRAAELRPRGWAVADADVAFSYAELAERAAVQASRLRRAGLPSGAVVMLEATNAAGYLVSYLAMAIAGYVVAPRDPSTHPAEMRREQSYLRAHAVISPPPRGEPGIDQYVRWLPDAAGDTPFAFDGEHPPILLPTSGTGGLPKRAVHDPERILANAAAHAQSVQLTSDDVSLVALSPAFGYCNTAQLLAQISVAGRIVFATRPTLPGDVAALVRRYPVTTTTMIPQQLLPPMLTALATTPTLRQVVTGGGPLSVQRVYELVHQLGIVELVQTWGMTEAGPRLTTWRSTRDLHKVGSVGLPLAGVRITAAAPPGGDQVAGELVAETPYLMRGYAGNPAETRRVVRDGRLWTGDHGRVDDDGYVYVDGRIKNVVNISGRKVSAEEVEGCLSLVPGIAKVQVYGEHDARTGERLVARVVMEDGAPVPNWREHLKDRLPRYKWPVDIEVVPRIPTTVTGKVRRW